MCHSSFDFHLQQAQGVIIGLMCDSSNTSLMPERKTVELQIATCNDSLKIK